MDTFPNINAYTVIDIPIFDVGVINYNDSIVEQRYSNSDNVRYKYKVTYKNLDETKVGQIVDFFISCVGSFKAFYWNHPISGEVKTVRFDMDKIDVEYFAYKLSNTGEILLIGVVE